ncbi:MAG: hypothetical protein ABL949_15910 [Fimbriimonadaceae bacterium]
MKSKFFIVVSLFAVVGLASAQGGGGGQRGGGQFGRGGGGNSISSLLNRADVQGEIKLTDDQKTKLTEMRVIRGQRGAGGGAGGGGGQGGGQRGQGGGAGAGGGQQQDAEAMRKAAEEREKNALAVLNADQNKRLKELFVQRSGNRAILNSTIQADLGMNDDQKKKIAELQAKQREAMMSVMEKMRNGELQREDMQAINEKNNKAMDEELGKVITTDQAAKLKSMGGAPFKFDEGGI